MIECVNGNGQGPCLMCLVLSGWSVEWSASLYYVRNSTGLYLRVLPYGFAIRTVFDSDNELRRAAFCYRHALMVEDLRKTSTDWYKE